MERDFFQLLQVAIGKRACLSHLLSDDEWSEVLDMAQRQAVGGILFEGIKRLPQEQWPKGNVVLKWTAMAENIRRRNMRTTEACLHLTRELMQDGFDVCILKGQANHVYYDRLRSSDALGLMRACGDIDAWVWPERKSLHPVKSIIDYCLRKGILLSLCHLHAEVKPLDGIPVEIHFRPSFFNAPWRDKVFQRLFELAKFSHGQIDGCGAIKKLRVDYDLIFQMNHIYRHLLDEGVGMRQILDFYVLMKDYRVEKSSNELMDEDWLIDRISACGMKRFASALMWVLREIFDLSREELLCAPSKRDGMFLLSEIMMAGNFGHYDTRMAPLEVKRGYLPYQIKKAFRRFHRNLRFLSYYPEEVICEPFARVAHFLWRKYRLYRF